MLTQMEEEILAEARSVAERKLNEAEKVAEEILQRARAEGEAEASAISQRNQENIKTSERKKLSDAKRKAALQTLREKNVLVEAVLNEARENLKSAATGEHYVKTLRAMLESSVAQFGEGEVHVRLTERDLKQRDNIVKHLKLPPKVKLQVDDKPLDSLGGFILSTADDRVRVDNSFEARLRFIEGSLRREIAEILFGG
ncbi:MAG: V-type ATP synthase subunit E [Candidatus Bathyarchaeia archaeon]